MYTYSRVKICKAFFLVKKFNFNVESDYEKETTEIAC